VGTFIELKEQAEEEIRTHIRSTASDSTSHFTVDHTNYFVDRGAALLAALRLWAESRQKTDADLQALIDSANAATLQDIAEELAQNRDPDELHASLQLQGIAYETPHQLYDTLGFARKGLRPS
jgi:Arc/MetJ-type ribon-helix-helix transcriptional regulator